MESFIKDSLAILPREEYHLETFVQNEDLVRLEEPIKQHIRSDPIEDIVKDPLHDTIMETIEDLKYPRDYFSKDDHRCILELPQEEIIIETYKENYDEFYKVYDGTPPCSLHSDKDSKISFPCKIFETGLSKEDYCELEDEYSQERDAMDEASPIFDKGMDDGYWTYIEKPIFDVSREGSVDLETFGDLGIEEGHVKLSYDHSKSQTSISNEDFERKCIEESNLMQSMESYFKPTSSHS